MRSGRQHGDDDVTGSGGLGGAGGPLAATGDKVLDCLGVEIETRYIMTGFQQIGGHWAPHVAEADEADCAHGILPLVNCSSRSPMG